MRNSSVKRAGKTPRFAKILGCLLHPSGDGVLITREALMSDPEREPWKDLERFRDYLRLLARFQLPARLRAPTAGNGPDGHQRR